MQTYVITIGREFGSSGCEIGQRLAEKLNIRYYDREILELAAKDMGVSVPDAADVEKTIYQREKNIFTKLGYNSQYLASNQLIDAQAQIIRQIATDESCIIMGRCADYILKEFKYHMAVYIYAPMQVRNLHIQSTYGLDHDAAERMITEIDRQRHYYYKYVTGTNRGDRHNRDIVINSDFLGIDGTVDILYDMAVKKFPFAGSPT